MSFTIGLTPGDPIVLRNYVDRYRTVLRTRLISVAALVAAVASSVSVNIALQFAVVHFLLFGLSLWAVDHAAKNLEAPLAAKLLQDRSRILSFLISCHAVWLALYVNVVAPTLHVECVVLVITLFVLSSLQVHLSPSGFVLSVAPPVAAFFMITGPEQVGDVGPRVWAGSIFVVATLAAAWRQQRSDRDSAITAADLARRNKELVEAVSLAETASRAKSDFLAVTSHEVRTPLNAVLVMAGVLSRELKSRRHSELARSIETAGAMLLQLLNGILEFSRFETGKATLHSGPAHLPSLVERIDLVWRMRCQEAGVTLRCDVSGLAPAPWVVADTGRVEQVLVNLVSNAVKFSPDGAEVLVQASSVALPDGRAKLRFEVLDRGPGVSPQDHARIFEAYEQTALGRDAGGAGLGLAICRSNIALMDGRFDRDDRPGGGSVFWFEFEADLAAAPEAESSPNAPEVSFAKLRILAADDHPINREVLKLILDPAGADLCLVEDGQQAVEAARAGYDIILMDAKMPVMDGAVATMQIRKEEARTGRRTPIVMLTANVFPADIARYIAAGADRVLAKPINVKELLAVVAELSDDDLETGAVRPRPRRNPRRHGVRGRGETD